MKLKIIIFMVLVVLFTIFVTQNTMVIPVNIFFWHVEMSVIVLITLTGLIGMILGFILLKIFEHNEHKHIKEIPKQPETRTESKKINP
jgi:uncharacterized integral membrane protein